MKKRIKQIFVTAVLVVSLCVGCGLQNTAGDEADSVSGRAASVTGTAVQSSQTEGEKKAIRYVAKDEKYGLALPEADAFGEELENMIYWSYAKRIYEKDDGLYGYLREKKALGRELKIKLSYAKDKELEMFNELCEYRPIYLVRLTIPELGGDTFWLEYHSSGLASRIGDYSEDDELEDDESEDEEDEDESYDWHEMGETTICIEEGKAETYEPQENITEEKEKILKDLRKEIAACRGRNEDCAIYLQDFLPGDDSLSGVMLHYDAEVPISWLTIVIYYTKQGEYYCLDWHPRTSTMFNGSEYSKEAAKEAIKEQEEAILVDHCLMAYRIKGKEMISLKE